ncbi:MAG TPA: carboxymuconolactone decarboxylase family protein [Alphaproteobacteria bacterium]|jgi:alkyl hydroperoxide reductase subunit D
MSLDALKDKIPDYAKDIKLNLSSLTGDETLSKQQLWGTLLAAALASRNDEVIAGIGAEAAANLSPEAQNAAKAANALMAMNNIYYKFISMMKSADYAGMPAKLRMNFMANPGVDKADFELWALAVSVINGCAGCVKSHEKGLSDLGVSREQIQTTIRIAAVVHATASALGGEKVLSSL